MRKIGKRYCRYDENFAAAGNITGGYSTFDGDYPTKDNAEILFDNEGAKYFVTPSQGENPALNWESDFDALVWNLDEN